MTAQKPRPQPLIVSITEAAQRVNISQAEAYRQIKLGRFPLPVAITEKRRGIRLADLERWVNERPTVVPDSADHFKAA